MWHCGSPMIELFRERDFTVIGYYQSILEAEGIPTFVRNQSLSSTEVSIPTFLPALCILNEEDQPRAMELLRERAMQPPASNTAEWTCPACHEQNPGNFDLCWSCQTPREESVP